MILLILLLVLFDLILNFNTYIYIYMEENPNPQIEAILSEERKNRAKREMARPFSVLANPFLTVPTTIAPSATPSLVGGYEKKYLKYKSKYLALKNSQ